jgi:hypothetical protein
MRRITASIDVGRGIIRFKTCLSLLNRNSVAKHGGKGKHKYFVTEITADS